MILVATQAVEVSLNIDLDTIYTDPAPLEALVQRFGRINRARRLAGLAPVHVYRQPDDGQKVYDAELVRRTLALLEREHDRPVDEAQVGAWVDEIYQGAVGDRWLNEYETSSEAFRRACLHTLVPFAASEDLEEKFYAAFDGVEVLPEALYDPYTKLQKDNPILADELLVPIRYGRYRALAKQGLLFPRDKLTPPIVRCHYDSDIGLDFDAFNSLEIED
jgi:CRISPR-associated endonuclease/helicase Cas3